MSIGTAVAVNRRFDGESSPRRRRESSEQVDGESDLWERLAASGTADVHAFGSIWTRRVCRITMCGV
eukprot:4077070-Prymnesium_polylepis.3